MSESSLLTSKHILICTYDKFSPELDYLLENFCGIVLRTTIVNDIYHKEPDRNIYLCGNADVNYDQVVGNIEFKTFYVIRQFSHNYDEAHTHYKCIDIGNVPVNIYNVGVYFRRLFGISDRDYFDLIQSEHKFQI